MTLPPVQEGAAVWRGSEFNSMRDPWIRRLSEADIAELEKSAAPIARSDFDIATLSRDDFPLPRLGKKISDLRRELLSGRGFVVLRGLPVAEYSEREAAVIFYGLGLYLGRACSQNAQGHLLGHVCDLKVDSRDYNVRIYQTNERQSFHTDSADVVGLLCLQPAKIGGKSLLVSALSVFNEMRAHRPDLLELLLKPIATDRRGEVPPGMAPFVMIPVFSWHAGYLTCFFQRQYIDSAQRFASAPRLTDEHVEALNLFDRYANDPGLNLSMGFARGDIQFVYNHHLLHDRTEFEDWPASHRQRHLLRLWLAIPGDRPLPTVFASRFGSVEIGNRGGIVVEGTRLRVPSRSDIFGAATLGGT